LPLLLLLLLMLLLMLLLATEQAGEASELVRPVRGA